MSSVRLHPKYGVNPTMPVCFWCQEPTGELALLGAGFKEQAPPKMVLGYDPCKTCAEGMALGITCIEVDSAAKLDRPPLQKEGALSVVAPTGRWLVIKEEAIIRFQLPPEMEASVIAQRKFVCEKALFDKLIEQPETPKEEIAT